MLARLHLIPYLGALIGHILGVLTCEKKNKATSMPIKLIYNDPIVRPTIILKTPTEANKGDNAEANSFTIHNAGAGQCSRRKTGMLINAAKQAKKVVRI